MKVSKSISFDLLLVVVICIVTSKHFQVNNRILEEGVKYVHS